MSVNTVITFISMNCDATMRLARAPRSIHICRSPAPRSPRAARALRLHLRSNAPRASRYPNGSPDQYLTRARRTSSSNGKMFSKTCVRAAGGAAARPVNRLVISAEVWLKSRRRASEETRRYHS